MKDICERDGCQYSNGYCNIVAPAYFNCIAICSSTTLQPSTPTLSPTKYPLPVPSQSPTKYSSSTPTASPTKSPSSIPTISPTKYPTLSPSIYPTINPSSFPSNAPSSQVIIGGEAEYDSMETTVTTRSMINHESTDDTNTIILIMGIIIGILVLCVCVLGIYIYISKITISQKRNEDVMNIELQQKMGQNNIIHDVAINPDHPQNVQNTEVNILGEDEDDTLSVDNKGTESSRISSNIAMLTQGDNDDDIIIDDEEYIIEADDDTAGNTESTGESDDCLQNDSCFEQTPNGVDDVVMNKMNDVEYEGDEEIIAEIDETDIGMENDKK